MKHENNRWLKALQQKETSLLKRVSFSELFSISHTAKGGGNNSPPHQGMESDK